MRRPSSPRPHPAWLLASALLVLTAGAAPLPASLDDLGPYELTGLVFESPDQARRVLDAFGERLAALDPAERDDVRDAVAWLAENCPYNAAFHETVAVLGAAISKSALPALGAPDDAPEQLRPLLERHAAHLDRLRRLHAAHVRLLTALGQPPADLAGAPPIEAHTARLGRVLDRVSALDAELAADIGTASEVVRPVLGGMWPPKVFLFVYGDTLQAAAVDARKLAALTAGDPKHAALHARSVAFEARAEALGHMIAALTSLYC